jgi:hypothetical protein
VHSRVFPELSLHWRHILGNLYDNEAGSKGSGWEQPSASPSPIAGRRRESLPSSPSLLSYLFKTHRKRINISTVTRMCQLGLTSVASNVTQVSDDEVQVNFSHINEVLRWQPEVVTAVPWSSGKQAYFVFLCDTQHIANIFKVTPGP